MSTLTVYPDPGDPGTTTVDGHAGRSVVDEDLATIRAGAGSTHGATSIADSLFFKASTTLNQFSENDRIFLLFDTSALGAGASISAAVLSLFGFAKTNGLGDPDYHIAAATPASNTSLADSDYTQVGTTSFANITYANWSTVAYNDFTLDANGIANISLTGVSKFSGQTSWDINNNFTGVWTSGANSKLQHNMADVAGNANDPKLVITYSTGSGPTTDQIAPAIQQLMDSGGFVGTRWV